MKVLDRILHPRRRKPLPGLPPVVPLLEVCPSCSRDSTAVFERGPAAREEISYSPQRVELRVARPLAPKTFSAHHDAVRRYVQFHDDVAAALERSDELYRRGRWFSPGSELRRLVHDAVKRFEGKEG